MPNRLDENRIPRAAASSPFGAPVPLARVNALVPFFGFLNTVGAPTDHLLCRARIPLQLLDDQEALIPVYSAYRFLELAAGREHLEDLGTVVGWQASSFELGAFGQALQRASTVYEYLQTGIRLIGTHSGATSFWLSQEGDLFRLSQHLKGPAGFGRCIADLFTLVITLSTLRRLVGPGWSPGEVRLMAGDEALLGDRECLGDARIIPGQRHSSFTISRSLMERPVRFRIGKAALANGAPPVAGSPMPADFLSSMEHLVTSLVGDGYPGLQIAAEAAGMSPRTLQRRLTQAGTTYAGMVTASRMRLARDWLNTSDVPIAEIAAMLGYTEPSNFTRAFRRETGLSPQAYRQRRLCSWIEVTDPRLQQ
jgi:AraC-like DNA-binding protein